MYCACGCCDVVVCSCVTGFPKRVCWDGVLYSLLCIVYVVGVGSLYHTSCVTVIGSLIGSLCAFVWVFVEMASPCALLEWVGVTCLTNRFTGVSTGLASVAHAGVCGIGVLYRVTGLMALVLFGFVDMHNGRGRSVHSATGVCHFIWLAGWCALTGHRFKVCVW